MDDALQSEVLRIGTRHFWKSIKRKLALLVTAVIAISVVIGLDAMRAELQEATSTPYRNIKSLKTAAKGDAPLDKAIVALSDDAKFATADALFEAVLAKTDFAERYATQEKAIRERFNAQLATIDGKVDALLANPPAKGLEEDIEKSENHRTALLQSRGRRLDEVNQARMLERIALRRTFDEKKYAAAAQQAFRFDARLKRLWTPTDPLSVIYDLLWYAALVIGVLALVALLLAPLFTSLSLTGAEDSFMEQVRSVVKRPGGRVVTSGIASLAAVGVGAVALVNSVSGATNSPWNAPGVGPQRVIERKVEHETRIVTVTDTTSTRKPDDPPPTPPPDPRIDPLLVEVNRLRETTDQHATALSEHEVVVQSVQTLPEAIRGIDSKVGGLMTRDEAQVQFNSANQAIDTRVRRAEEYFDVAISGTVKTGELKETVEDATKGVGSEATKIRSAVYMPYQIGERPSRILTFLGFDRYRITANVPIVLREIGAGDIADKVETLVSDELLSSDDVLLALRAELCPGRPVKNCRDFEEWRGVVLRTARVR